MSKSAQEEYEWQIIDRVAETSDTYTYSFHPTAASQRFSFNIGQSVTINAFLKRPTTSGSLEVSLVQRAYSIASSPTRDRIDLTIKDEKPMAILIQLPGRPMGLQLISLSNIAS